MLRRREESEATGSQRAGSHFEALICLATWLRVLHAIPYVGKVTLAVLHCRRPLDFRCKFWRYVRCRAWSASIFIAGGYKVVLSAQFMKP